MYLVITAAAAIITTIIWYVNAPKDKYKLSTLCFIYWGATLMWFVDHVMEYLTEVGEFVEITLDATLLGVTVIICGLLVWLIMQLVSVQKKVFNKLSQSKK